MSELPAGIKTQIARSMGEPKDFSFLTHSEILLIPLCTTLGESLL